MDTNLFSEREKDVIEHLLQGKSNKRMALDLGISGRTVEFHLGNIYSKLGVHSRSEAILKLAEGQLRESTENPLAQLPALYPGLSEKQAIHTYLEENGYTHKGPWECTVELSP